jgi:hypothetical protein
MSIFGKESMETFSKNAVKLDMEAVLKFKNLFEEAKMCDDCIVLVPEFGTSYKIFKINYKAVQLALRIQNEMHFIPMVKEEVKREQCG